MQVALLAIASWLLPLLYLGLVIDYGAAFFLRTRMHSRSPWIPVVAIFHGVFLIFRGIHLNHPPLTSGYEILSLVALSCTVVYYAGELVSKDRRSGLFVFLAVFLLQYTSSVFSQGAIAGGGEIEAGTEAAYAWHRTHVAAATFAYTALAFAALHGTLYLIGRRNLKQHRFGLLLDRLPPLELLGKSSRYALLAGFVFMTVSVVSGSIFFSQAQSAHPGAAMELKVVLKIVTGSAAWLICGTAVAGSLIGKWSDARLSYIATGGFLAIVVLFVASLALS